MIPANELRIGNKVCVRNPYHYAAEAEVYNIRVAMCSIKGVTPSPMSFKITELYPIPLTIELLERCGFTKNKYSCEINIADSWYLCANHNDIEIYLDKPYLDADACPSLEFVPNTSIRSLHQLQNIYFALTHEELIIK